MSRRACFLFTCLVLLNPAMHLPLRFAIGQNQEPVVFTTSEDHRNMLQQLGITKLRPGPSGDPTAANAANTDETKANPFPQLPPLMTSNDGQQIDTPDQWWSIRRPEIVAAFQQEVLGQRPAQLPTVTWEVKQEREILAGDVPAIEQQVIGTVDNSRCPSIEVKISMSVVLPRESQKPVPLLIMFGWSAFDPAPPWLRRREGEGRPEDVFIQAGWGYAKLNPASIQDDRGGFQSFGRQAEPEKVGMGLTRGVIGLCNLGQPRQPADWGALQAWAWGATEARKYLATRETIDPKRIGIEGVSRYGKAALVTMAMDTEFAMVLIGSSGEGGTSLYRRNFGEAVENLAGSGEYHWMAGNFLKYAAAEASFGSKTPNDLPVDAHQLIALCAPRLTFISYGIPEKGDALWLDQKGSFMAAIAAQPAYRLLGANGLGRSDDYQTEEMPPVLQGLLDGELAWRQHDGGHTDIPNYPTFIQWAQQHWDASGVSK